MGHSENKVNWCLRKAEKELKEGRKHRGLVIKDSGEMESRLHLTKAEHNLRAISYFSTGGFSDWGMSAVFYCIYHCFLAIIEKFGYESRNQECTIALIKHLNETGKINLDDKFISSIEFSSEDERHESSIIEKREASTYGTTVSADGEEIGELTNLCKKCLDVTKDIIFGE
jgi:uncharacterized protein (UPF0332 family)